MLSAEVCSASPFLLPLTSQQRLVLVWSCSRQRWHCAWLGRGAGARAAHSCTPVHTHGCVRALQSAARAGGEGRRALRSLPWVAGGQLFREPLEPLQASKAMFLQLMHMLFWGCLQQRVEVLHVKLLSETARSSLLQAVPYPPCIQLKEQRAHGSCHC